MLSSGIGGGGGGFDPDAAAYFAALPTDPGDTFKNGWNTFVLAAKANGYYSNFIAAYPFPGTNAGNDSINAINPALFAITWNGTVTHNSNGIAGNGTDGYGDTGLNALSVLTMNDIHLSIYSRTNSAATRFEMGCLNTDASNTMQFQIRTASDVANFLSFDAAGGSVLSVSSVTNSTGLFLASRRASNDAEMYRNGSSIGTQTSGNGGARPNFNVFICGRNLNGSLNSPTSRNYAFASIGSSFTDGEAAAFYTDCQALQTTLSRQV